MKPTQEQDRALNLFGTGNKLVIEAGAGTGKTSTLKLLAQSTRRRGQYVAFNKSIVVEAGEKMPPSVYCSTAHSLAFRAVVTRNKRIAERLKRSQRCHPNQIARAIGVKDIEVELHGTDGKRSKKRLAAGFLGGLAMRSISRFCQSADREPCARHVPYIDGIDAPGEHRNNNAVANELAPSLRRAWHDIIGDEGQLPFKHDHYLKMYHLSSPTINADFILFDEAQDANPVLAAIVSAQTHSQLVFVGDSQQAIYAFTGAVNAMEDIKANGGSVAFLSKSFRFGHAIAEKANEILSLIPGATLRLTGNEAVASDLRGIENPDCILCRTNACAVRIFIDRLDEHPHIVGGCAEVTSFANAARELKTQGRTSHPELACFSSWGEVQEYVANDEQGNELRLLVNLIDQFGEDEILTKLARMPDEKDAGFIISTAHKAKGREWDTVKLADDFPPPKDSLKADDLRLIYVAVTRARLVLDASSLIDRKRRQAELAI